jgi:hypothetical protein
MQVPEEANLGWPPIPSLPKIPWPHLPDLPKLPSISDLVKDVLPVATTLFAPAYKALYERSPIVLVEGIASFMPLKKMPISLLTNPIASVTQFFSKDTYDGAQWQVSGGSELFKAEVGKYPWFNADTAANSMMKKSCIVSMMMFVGLSGDMALAKRQTLITALIKAVNNHMARGGRYHVFTPALPYYDCLLLSITDKSGQYSQKVPQVVFEFTFEKLLIKEEDALKVLNNIMDKAKKQAAPSILNAVANKIKSLVKDAVTGVLSKLKTDIFSHLPHLPAIPKLPIDLPIPKLPF